MNKLTKQLDGRDIAAENDLQICLELVRFGWLTSRMITELVWPEAKQGQRSAQRRLKSLKDRKIIVQGVLDNGIRYNKLTQQGASFLHSFGHTEVPSRGTRDAKTGNYFHRALANNFLISGLPPGAKSWPEYQVLRRRAPMSWLSFEGQKQVPDAIADFGDATYWIEAENAAKSPKKLERLYRLSRHFMPDENGWMFDHNDTLYAIRGMIFVCPSLARVRSVAKAFAQSDPEDFATRQTYIVYAPMTMSLVWPDNTHVATAYDIARECGFIKSDTVLNHDHNGWDWLGK